MRILVTGGAGYIGSVTSDLLVQEGHEVTVFDSLVSGHRSAVPKGAAFVRGDLLDRSRIQEVLEKKRTEAILHFAGNIEVGNSMRAPFGYLADNVAGGLNLFQAAVEGGVGRILLTSSSNVFDRSDRESLDETAAPQPASPYGESKWYLERSLAWLEKTHGVRFAILRCFNAAGATADRGEDHDPETHLIPLLLQVAQGRRPHISIFGSDLETPDGTCIRDYVHVWDVAQAHLLALRALDRGSRVYHLGTGMGFSVAQVVEAVRRVTQKPIATVSGPRRKGDPARLIADPSRIRHELGWVPRIPEIDRIVESAWSWMRNNPDGYPE
jgi:UDP-glucose 4-epimerase